MESNRIPVVVSAVTSGEVTVALEDPEGAICRGIGRRYAAAVRSALERRTEWWRVYHTEWGPVWYNGSGFWSAREYAIILGDDPRLAVTGRSGRGLSLFRLDEFDAKCLAERFRNVDLYRQAMTSEDAKVLYSSDLHGDVLEWRGQELRPSEPDPREWAGCRGGQSGTCPDCDRHVAAGHVLIRVDQTSRMTGSDEERVFIDDAQIFSGRESDREAQLAARGYSAVTTFVAGRSPWFGESLWAWGEQGSPAALLAPKPSPVANSGGGRGRTSGGIENPRFDAAVCRGDVAAVLAALRADEEEECGF